MTKRTLYRGQLIILLAFWICLALGQLQRLQVTPTLSLYGHDVVIGIWLGWLWWHKHLRFPLPFAFHNFSLWWRRVPWAPVVHPLIWLTGAIMVAGLGRTLVLEPTAGVTGLLYGLRVLGYGLFSWSVVARGPLPKIDLRWGYTVAGLMVVLLGFAQYWLMPDTRFLAILGWDDHYYRLISTWFDPAFTGVGLVLTVLLLSDFRRWWGTWIVGVLQMLVVVAIMLTFSRSSWMSLGLVLFMQAVWSLKQRAWQSLFIVGCSLAVLLTAGLWLPRPTGEGVNLARTSTIHARQANWGGTLGTMQPLELLIGRGVFVPQPTLVTPPVGQPDHGRQADNIVLWLISGLGVLGSVTAGLLGVILMLKSKLPASSVVAVAAVFLHGLFNNTVWQPLVFLMLCGVVLTAEKGSPEKAKN